jgi:hypothetical protein
MPLTLVYWIVCPMLMGATLVVESIASTALWEIG